MRVCFGLQKAVWGFFRKLVIADQLAIMVYQVLNKYSDYTDLVFVFGLAGQCFSYMLSFPVAWIQQFLV